MEELAKVEKALSSNTSSDNDSELNCYLREQKDEYIRMLNGIPNIGDPEVTKENVTLSFQQIQEHFLKIEKAKHECQCQQKTLHEKASCLTSFVKDILGYKDD